MRSFPSFIHHHRAPEGRRGRVRVRAAQEAHGRAIGRALGQTTPVAPLVSRCVRLDLTTTDGLLAHSSLSQRRRPFLVTLPAPLSQKQGNRTKERPERGARVQRRRLRDLHL